MRVFKRDAQPTRIEKTVGGYKVNLFGYRLCGCGPHPHYTVEYLVTESGNVSEITREKIYEDPWADGLCVD